MAFVSMLFANGKRSFDRSYIALPFAVFTAFYTRTVAFYIILLNNPKMIDPVLQSPPPEVYRLFHSLLCRYCSMHYLILHLSTLKSQSVISAY
jgi:hypothetical protein